MIQQTGAAGAERDIRVQILNSFLTTPHGQLAALAAVHTAALERDPLFYGRLAVWYFEQGEVRDHKTLFAAHLLTSDYPEFREAGWVLLQSLAPYEVARVLDHAKRVIGKTPRVLRSAVAQYLRTREANPAQFDGAALRSRQTLKHLYASLRLKPGSRAQAILFDDRPPANSPLAALKRLAKADSAEEQTAIILDAQIPYTIAVGAVKHVTPALLVALIHAMSPQEVINNLAALRRRGALDDPDVRVLIDQKLRAATTDTRVSTMKTKRAMAAADLDAATMRTLTEVTDARVAAKIEIRRPTALFVDKSASMTEAIEVAKQLAALIGAVVSADFRVYTFDTAAFELAPIVVTERRRSLFSALLSRSARNDPPAPEARRSTLSEWERVFTFVKPAGRTSIGAPLAKLHQERIRIEQIVLVTDEQENEAPLFRDAYAAYAAEMGIAPSVVIVHVGTPYRLFGDELQRRGIELLRFEFDGDYYSLPNLLPLLARPTRGELVDLIMARALPRRPPPATGAAALGDPV